MPAKHLGTGLQGELHLLVQWYGSLLPGGRSLFLRGKLPWVKLRRALPVRVLRGQLPSRPCQCLLLVPVLSVPLRPCSRLYLPSWPALWD